MFRLEFGFGDERADEAGDDVLDLEVGDKASTMVSCARLEAC